MEEHLNKVLGMKVKLRELIKEALSNHSEAVLSEHHSSDQSRHWLKVAEALDMFDLDVIEDIVIEVEEVIHIPKEPPYLRLVR